MQVLFGGDGSYYVTTPYHPLNRALAGKITVNYAKAERDELSVSLAEAEELAVVDDDDRRLKIAHHPDGFLQFSGHGIRSGLDSEGMPKGMGVFSWPLALPTLGPSFGLIFSNPVACGRTSLGRARTVVLTEADIEHMRPDGIAGLGVTGFYFPVRWREFVIRDGDGDLWINLVHPTSQAVKVLRVILASKESDLPGFIGLEARPHGLDTPTGVCAFFLGTSTGSLRRNEDGDLVGDQLVCAYPPPDFDDAHLPSLNFPLPAPPYTAPPGTTAIVPDEQAESEPTGGLRTRLRRLKARLMR